MEEEDDDQYVLHFDQLDLDNYEFGDVRSMGNAYEVFIHPVDDDEDDCCQMCLPSFKIDENGVPLEISNKRNVELVFNIDPENEEHSELAEWFEGFDDWIISGIIENHSRWFGHLWQEGGKMENKPLPPPEVLASMFERKFDGTSFSVRVPLRNGVPQIECFDIEHTTIPFSEIKNCEVIPIIEFKGIRLYSKKSCCDIVLRGLCAQCTYEDMGIEYKICEENDEVDDIDEDYYGTDDDESEEDEEQGEEQTEEQSEEQTEEQSEEQGEEQGEEQKEDKIEKQEEQVELTQEKNDEENRTPESVKQEMIESVENVDLVETNLEEVNVTPEKTVELP